LKVHELKTWPDPFLELKGGKKHHEFRRDDRGFQAGDVLVLREFCPPPEQREGLAGTYTGRVLARRVTSITRGGSFGVPEGYAVMSVEDMK
jgi:Domain of unknown function (DUF3850)